MKESLKLSLKEKDLLIDVLNSYSAKIKRETWGDEKGRIEKIERVSELANKIYYNAVKQTESEIMKENTLY